jgi:hypothetical protein
LMLLSAGPGGEGEEHAPVGLATKQRRCYGSPCAHHAVTVVVAAIFGRSSGLVSTSTAEACGSVAGARHAQEIKWCIPNVLGVAGGWIQSPEKSSRADCSLISAAKPRGCRRSGGGEPDVLDCVLVVESPMSRPWYCSKKRKIIAHLVHCMFIRQPSANV